MDVWWLLEWPRPMTKRLSEEEKARRAHERFLRKMAPNDLDENHWWGWAHVAADDDGNLVSLQGETRDIWWVHRCRMPNGSTPMMLGRLDITTGKKHRLVAEEPLHVEPSVLCGQCQDHGFIRNGKWVKA